MGPEAPWGFWPTSMVHRGSVSEIQPCLPSTPLPPVGNSPQPPAQTLSPCERTGWLYSWCRRKVWPWPRLGLPVYWVQFSHIADSWRSWDNAWTMLIKANFILDSCLNYGEIYSLSPLELLWRQNLSLELQEALLTVKKYGENGANVEESQAKRRR